MPHFIQCQELDHKSIDGKTLSRDTVRLVEAHALLRACLTLSKRAFFADIVNVEGDWNGNDIEFKTRRAVFTLMRRY